MASDSVSAGRIFVAAPLADEVRDAIRGHLDRELHGRSLPGRSVSPDHWHFTLRFLGDTTTAQLAAVRSGLSEARLGGPFCLRLARLGAFPTPGRARVIWLGADEGAAELAALASVVETVTGAAGFEPESKPFRAHLTLSRLKPDGDVRQLLASVPPMDVGADIRQVVVFRSHLGPAGPRYEAVERYALE